MFGLKGMRARPMEHGRNGFTRGNSFVKPTTVNLGVPKMSSGNTHWSNLKDLSEFEKEKREHPEFDDKQIEQIVADHREKKLKLVIPFSYSAGGSRAEIERHLIQKIEASGFNSADFNYSLTPERKLGVGNTGMIIVRASPEKITALRQAFRK